MSEFDIREERLRKLRRLKERGIDPYPADSHKDIDIKEVLGRFDDIESAQKKIHVSGRIFSRRGQGGITFIDLHDGSGKLQAVLQKEDVAEYDLFIETVDIGDFIDVSGVLFKTNRGERSLKVQKWRMLSKSLLPIPDAWYGVKDEETRYRQRYLDLLLNEELRGMFERRARFWQAIRNFYLDRSFLEVETPAVELSPGGADARPFETHHNALDIDVYLRISAGELWQKRLLIAGFPKVFEIGRIFRNEGQSREHVQDYTQLESYEAFKDVRYGAKFVQQLYRHIVKEVYGKYTFEIGEHTVDLADEWKNISYTNELKRAYGFDYESADEAEVVLLAKREGAAAAVNKARAADYLWKKLRKDISGPAYLIDVPVDLEPLAKRSKDKPGVVERLQVIIAGSEIGKGYSELNDPQDQKERFEAQQKMRDAGDTEAQRLDNDYVRAMEYGMPPAFGFGVSERLFAFLENKPVHEAQLFPILRPRND